MNRYRINLPASLAVTIYAETERAALEQAADLGSYMASQWEELATVTLNEPGEAPKSLRSLDIKGSVYALDVTATEAEVADIDEDIPAEEWPNARLIAAAPELLELAQQIVLEDDTASGDYPDSRIPDDIVSAARALLARLEGGAQ